MNKLICASTLLLALLSCTQSKTNNDSEKQRIDKVCDKFMKLFQGGNFSNALQLLKQNSTIASSSFDTLKVTISSQMKKGFLSYGKMLSYEFISEYKIKDFITKRFYILKLEKYYLKFDFTLYNNGTSRKITEFNFNESLIELLY